MAFQEKSAWVMSISLLLTSAFYFTTIISMSHAGSPPAPNTPTLLVFVVVLTLIAIVGHIVIAGLAPSEANNNLDEREKQIVSRAGHVSTLVFRFSVTLSLVLYLLSPSGDLLFYTVFGSLIASQLVEYLTKIILYHSAST